jgi:serpin B
MWTCPKCGEQIEDQFDSCWKCAAQPEPVGPRLLTARRIKFFFLVGFLFELAVILAAFALPDGALAVDARNFIIVTHFPLIWMSDWLRVGDNAPGVILILLIAWVLMGSFWAILIYLGARLARFILSPFVFNRRRKIILWCALGLLGVAGLAWIIISARPETPVPFASSPEIKAVVDGNNAFALDLYRTLKDRPGNLFFSPYGISTALAMTCAGARGPTKMEITNALHLSLPPEKLHPAFRALSVRMDKIQRWRRIVLKTANALWCQKNHPFSADFVRLVRENYSGAAKSVDFKNAGGAAEEINRWVDRETDHKITGGIAPEQLTPLTRLVLSDAIYFKGVWQHQFKARDTKPALFHVTTNETVTVPMMSQKGHFKMAFADDDSVELLELPYSGRDLSMIILLPSSATYYFPEAGHNDVHDLEQKLTPENLRSWLAKLDHADPHETRLALPRFTTTQSFDLVEELKSLGIKSAFDDDAADFSGMDGTTNLFVSEVIHKAFVKVDESGTEAAAITLSLAAAASKDDHFNVDHPFIFLIRDNGSGSILFLGRIIDPAK